MCSQIHRRQLALAGLLSSCLFAADTVTFVVGEWGPYTGQEMPGHGLATEIVSAACAAEGLSADVSFRPWKRAEVDVSKGASFATFPYQLIPERTDSFMFSDTICTSAMAILVAQGNPRTAALDVNRPEDLKGLQVGIVVGTDAVRFPLQKAGIAAEEVETPAQNLKKLELGRIDCIIDDRAVLLQTLAAACRADPALAGRFRILDKGFGETTNYRLMVSPRYPHAQDLLKRFNAGLRKIKADGQYRKILKAFGL